MKLEVADNLKVGDRIFYKNTGVTFEITEIITEGSRMPPEYVLLHVEKKTIHGPIYVTELLDDEHILLGNRSNHEVEEWEKK